MPAHRTDFSKADETRELGKGTLHTSSLDGNIVGKATFQPGWRWSNDVKPIGGGELCQGDHLGYAVSGTLHVVTDDGSEIDIGPGDAYVVRPGHDAWVVGDEPFVGLEFQSKTAETYARPN